MLPRPGEEPMTEHPNLTVLTDFLLGTLAPERVGTVVAHLLHGCERCQEEMEPLALAILSAEGFEHALTPEEEEAYDGAISEACRKVIATLREERAEEARGEKRAFILARFSESRHRASAPTPRPTSR
jgi:hypothetical protein